MGTFTFFTLEKSKFTVSLVTEQMIEPYIPMLETRATRVRLGREKTPDSSFNSYATSSPLSRQISFLDILNFVEDLLRFSRELLYRDHSVHVI